jgi:acyl-CoA hydrolase
MEMDETQKALLQMVKDRVNNVEDHKIDEAKLVGQLDNLISGIGGIEELAMEVERGEFELPEQEPAQCSICQQSKCRC